MREQWNEIPDFPDYEISDLGRVRRTEDQREIPTRTNREGFVMVTIRDTKFRQCTRAVAMLVAYAFLDAAPESYNSLIHLNGDRGDCRSLNLMWRPRWYALKYHRMFEDEPVRVRINIPAIGRSFSSLREFCTTYGLVELDTYVNLVNKEPIFHYGWIVQRQML